MDDVLPTRVEYGTLRKSAFGRTNLFLKTPNVIFREIRCSASSDTRQACASIFHTHRGNNEFEKPSNCACWHCCHAYDGNGFRLPRIFDPADGVYHVYGWFCSANCAKAYILEHSTFDRGYQMNIFVRMLRDIYGINTSVNEAPPRLSLSMFGGPFDIESFREQKNVCLTLTPPFISHCMLIEERQPIANVGEQTNVSQRGSVRGLRRPSEKFKAPSSSDDICAPQNDGLYVEFLKQKSATPEASSSEPPPAKRLRSKAAPKTTASVGLAKFASKG